MKHANELPARLDAIYARSDRMVGRRIADEYLLVPIVGRGAEVEAIYNLNTLAALIWEGLDGKTSGETIVRAIATRYDVDDETAAVDYRTFIGQLQSIRAVVLVDPSPHPVREDRARAPKKQEDKP